MIAGDPLKDWVEWDTNLTVPKYAARVAKPSFWGGGIEMAATSHLFNANVHVYEANSASNGLKVRTRRYMHTYECLCARTQSI